VVADRENDMAGLAIDAQNVDYVSLFDGHWPFYPGDQMPVPVRLAARGGQRKAVFFFRSRLTLPGG
jgi:hypothetical protein